MLCVGSVRHHTDVCASVNRAGKQHASYSEARKHALVFVCVSDI